MQSECGLTFLLVYWTFRPGVCFFVVFVFFVFLFCFLLFFVFIFFTAPGTRGTEGLLPWGSSREFRDPELDSRSLPGVPPSSVVIPVPLQQVYLHRRGQGLKEVAL